MNHKVKSQITMLMIVGLVIFIATSLVFYISKQTIRKQTEKIEKKMNKITMDTNPIKEYLSKCLDATAKEAIMDLGRQGGRIYESQGGTYPDYDNPNLYIESDGYNVPYNINPRMSSPLDYPWPTFPYKDSAHTTPSDELSEGYFGNSNFPPLNSSEGAHSIQLQIEKFVDKNLAGCIDPELFKERGITIRMDDPSTSVVIGRNHLNIKSTINATITNPETNELTELEEVLTDVNIRLAELHSFAKDLANKDNQNINFDIGSQSNNRNPFYIEIERDKNPGDDLITITDKTSLINGMPFEFVFARKNRPPALYYISEDVKFIPKDTDITDKGMILSSQPKASDPDEDDVAGSGSFKVYLEQSLTED